MSHYRKNVRMRKNRVDQGIQSDPVHEEYQFQDHIPPPTKSVTLTSQQKPSAKRENIDHLINNMETVQNQSKLLTDNNKKTPKQFRRSLNLNMMKLQDKNFEIKGNIYNIAVGQIFNRESYLNNLNSQISTMRAKIRQLEQQEENQLTQTIQIDYQSQRSQELALDRSRTIQEKKSQCGRIYSRANTPSSSQRRYLKVGNKDSEPSSYYKWRPDVDEPEVFTNNKNYLVRSGKKIETQHSGSSRRKMNNTQYQKPLINYRVKQKNPKSSIPSEQKSMMSGEKHLTVGENVRESSKKFKTDEFSNNKTEKTEQNPEILDKKKSEKEEKIQQEYLEPYSGIVFKDISQFEIKDVNDDFRAKVVQQLQVPQGFPIETPQIGSTFEEYEKLGQKIYTLFGVNLKRESKKMITRKFKNGVYYQLDTNKHILWYLSGSFYLGGWDTDLPTEGQKHGFGLQYIPNKYIYLGEFKQGMKHGKGSIKLLNHPQKFMAYEGEWQKGKPHGHGKHIDQKDTRYIGGFLGGEKTGTATILTQDGLYYEGGVRKGLKNGQGMEKLVNGDCYMGSFQQGKFHGMGLYKWKNGSSYEGEFHQGKRQGKGIWKGANGDIFQGEYHADMKNGWGKFVWVNGQIYEGQFKDDIRHGQGNYRHPSGKVGKFMWKEGQIDYRLYSKEEQQYRARKLKEEEKQKQEIGYNQQEMY